MKPDAHVGMGQSWQTDPGEPHRCRFCSRGRVREETCILGRKREVISQGENRVCQGNRGPTRHRGEHTELPASWRTRGKGIGGPHGLLHSPRTPGQDAIPGPAGRGDPGPSGLPQPRSSCHHPCLHSSSTLREASPEHRAAWSIPHCLPALLFSGPNSFHMAAWQRQRGCEGPSASLCTPRTIPLCL